MSFQKNVYVEQAIGREGTIARNNPLTVIPMITEGEETKAGGFGFTGTTAGQQVLGVSAGATEVEGLLVYGGLQIGVTPTNGLIFIEGVEVAVLKKGYGFIRATTEAVYGHSVYVNPTTGEIQTGTVAPADFIDTGWKIQTSAIANEVSEAYKL